MNIGDFVATRPYFGQSPAQERFDYDGTRKVLYVGWAERGAASSDNKWFIQKYTYTDGMVTLIQGSQPYAVWDDRTDSTKVTFA